MSNIKDAANEKSIFTTAYPRALIAIRGFIQGQEEKLSATNIQSVNKMEMLRNRLKQE